MNYKLNKLTQLIVNFLKINIMNKYVFIYTILFSLGIMPILGQYQSTTVQTPRGVNVDALRFVGEDFDSDEIEYWNDWWTNGYNCRILANSTNYYNCHGYAWHNIEGHMSQSELRWINDVDEYGNPIYNVTKYYSGSNPSYIQSTNVNHRKVSYYPRDHSALTTENQDSLISKWAYGPLVKHTPQQCPFYPNSQIKYYRLDPYVTGSSDELCANQERTYTSNTTISGSTYSWTRNTSFLDYVSGQGTTNYRVKAKSGVKGNAWVRLQITTPSGEVATTPYKNFWVGKPSPTITGEQYPECDDINWYFLDPEDKWGTYYWSVTSGLTIIGSRYGYKAQIRADEEGSAVIYCDVTNDCGTDYGSLAVYVDCFGFKMSPNPADDYLEISLDENKVDLSNITEFEVKIYNIQEFLIYQTKIQESSFIINTSKFIPGTYSVQLIYNGKSYSQQLVISR
ncbi:MAG: hypothetical protein A3K77_03805 [Euryarchaeota archaeon RBG_13_31_8]|nr:MAG: hypothetical protein A3K77_03805 [Euryarchaeota archaeon RBG_13_31_8]